MGNISGKVGKVSSTRNKKNKKIRENAINEQYKEQHYFNEMIEHNTLLSGLLFRAKVKDVK